MITVVLPISRTKYLDRVLGPLSGQTRRADSLIVVFEGSDSEFETVKKKVNALGFGDVICVKSLNKLPGISISDRRRNISGIHNQIAGLIRHDSSEDWVFSIEDDGILPPDALERLLRVVDSHPNVGIATGVELGRWGSPYVGAWTVDDIHEAKNITSLDSKAKSLGTIEEIDACGLYCALIRADKYVSHHFFMNNGLGPDVNLGIFVRMEGLRNYIDWGVHVTHLTTFWGRDAEIPATDTSVQVSMTRLRDNIWQINT